MVFDTVFTAGAGVAKSLLSKGVSSVVSKGSASVVNGAANSAKGLIGKEFEDFAR
ncbi:hypothetical protein D3C81_2180370 [compost metagenome]